jgi:soluble lytic murein transglycosylase-like protein
MGLFKYFLLLGIYLASSFVYASEQEIIKMISENEKKYNILPDLLISIAKHESGLKPLVLNIQGITYEPKSIEEATSKLKSLIEKGITNIDIGIMQINYYFHQDKFKDISSMLDVGQNIEYAAKFLRLLYQTHGSWSEALRRYHSSDRNVHNIYAKKILREWVNL